MKRFNNVLCRNCVSHYINLQALKQTSATTTSHYVLLWRRLHFKTVKIQGFLTFVFSILIPFKEKKPPQTYNKPNNTFTAEKSLQIYLHWARFSLHLHQWPMNGQGWAGESMGMEGGREGGNIEVFDYPKEWVQAPSPHCSSPH